jgi:uncharacterized phage protein gp47/JayE
MSLFPTRADLFRLGRAAVAATPNIKINPAVIDIPGSDMNLVVGVPSVMGEEVSARGAIAMRGAFAELAREDALDRVLYDRYGLLRFSAQPATVDVLLARPTTGGGAGIITAGAIGQTPDGTQFGLDSDAVFYASTVGVNVSATALVAGINGNVSAETVNQWGTSLFDSSITITNPKPASGGIDAEDDIAFLGRARGFFPTVARGTLSAIEFAAKQVPGVAVASATEIVNPTSGYPAAVIQLVIGDSNGNASSDLITAVVNMLLSYRAAGIYVQVIGGVVFQQAVAWRLDFKTGVDEALAIYRVRAVTVAVAQFLAPGPSNGILYKSSLLSAAKSVPGVIVSDSALVLPAGDVVPTSAQQMIRIAPTDISFQ